MEVRDVEMIGLIVPHPEVETDWFANRTPDGSASKKLICAMFTDAVLVMLNVTTEVCPTNMGEVANAFDATGGDRVVIAIFRIKMINFFWKTKCSTELREIRRC
jgi:hypothetical protein